MGLSHPKIRLRQTPLLDKKSGSSENLVSFNLKRKLKEEEIQNVKKQKINVEDPINAPRKSLKCETLTADKVQDLDRLHWLLP